EHDVRVGRAGEREPGSEDAAGTEGDEPGPHGSPPSARTAATVAAPRPQKVAVAAIERPDKRLTPQIPWPLVQPFPTRVPSPTSTPAIPITGSAGHPGSPAARKASGGASAPASTRPARNARRQPRSASPRI